MIYLGDQIFLLIISVVLLLQLLNFYYKDFVFRPRVVLPILIFLYILVGNVNLAFFQEIIGWYRDVQPNKGNYWALMSLICFISFLLFLKPKNNFIEYNIKENKETVGSLISEKKLNNFIFYLSLVSFLINTYNYISIGGVILFKQNLNGFERFALQEKLPIEKGITLSSFLIFPILLNLYFFKNNKLALLVLLICNSLFAFGLGHRQYLLMPIMIFILFLYSYGIVKNKYLLLTVLLLPLIVFLTAFYRGDKGNVDLESTSSFFGNEYRDYLRLQNERIIFQDGKTIASVFYNSIPQQVYSLFGVEKNKFRIYSAYILMDFWGNETGQRAGIWGEFYLNWGYWGVLFCFIIFAFIVSYVESKYLYANSKVNIKIVYSYIYSLLIFSVVASWASIGDDLGGQGILFFVFSKFIIKR